MLGLQSTSLGLPLQEARACWKEVEESYQPHQDLQLLLDAQASLKDGSAPPLGSNGALPASSAPAPTKTPAAVTPTATAASALARPQVLCFALSFLCHCSALPFPPALSLLSCTCIVCCLWQGQSTAVTCRFCLQGLQSGSCWASGIAVCSRYGALKLTQDMIFLCCL